MHASQGRQRSSQPNFKIHLTLSQSPRPLPFVYIFYSSQKRLQLTFFPFLSSVLHVSHPTFQTQAHYASFIVSSWMRLKNIFSFALFSHRQQNFFCFFSSSAVIVSQVFSHFYAFLHSLKFHATLSHFLCNPTSF